MIGAKKVVLQERHNDFLPGNWKLNKPIFKSSNARKWGGGGGLPAGMLKSRGVLLGIFVRGVPPGSPNPDPISDQNIPFSTPVFRPGL